MIYLIALSVSAVGAFRFSVYMPTIAVYIYTDKSYCVSISYELLTYIYT